MKLIIKSIVDRGILKRERIVMIAQTRIDVGQFALLEANYFEGGVNTDTRDVYWFPDKAIDQGDHVVLYTKNGIDKEKSLKSGRKSHFFYWGNSESKWGTGVMVPVLLQVEEWMALGPEDTE